MVKKFYEEQKQGKAKRGDLVGTESGMVKLGSYPTKPQSLYYRWRFSAKNANKCKAMQIMLPLHVTFLLIFQGHEET